MRKLLIYLNKYRKECILAPLFKLLEASFELIVPLVVAAIIDHGIAASNKSYIFKMGGVMVLLALIGLACSITAQYFAAKAAVEKRRWQKYLQGWNSLTVGKCFAGEKE